jgi:DNA-binding IclR family transcriptional regulator
VSSLTRMLAILDLFTERHPTLTADEIVERLKCSRPTGYRYTRELVSAGLLVRAAGSYSLGPRIIELDWQIRCWDPVLHESREVVQTLVARTGCSVTVMGLYGERIVTIHHEHGTERLEINYERGRPMPPFGGAPAKAILAFLPKSRLLRLYDRHRDELPMGVRRRGFGSIFEELQTIRRQGYAVSSGELDADKVGIAAPVKQQGKNTVGSICLVLTKVRYGTSNADLLARLIKEAAQKLGERLDAVLGEHTEAVRERSLTGRSR